MTPSSITTSAEEIQRLMSSEMANKLHPDGTFHVTPELMQIFAENCVELAKMKEQLSIGETSDGYHTFNELYEHRIVLYIALCRMFAVHNRVWRSECHSDGTQMEGWFVLGIDTQPGEQITYHLPMSKWEDCLFANTQDKAPKFDGHTSKDVLSRIAKL